MDTSFRRSKKNIKGIIAWQISDSPLNNYASVPTASQLGFTTHWETFRTKLVLLDPSCTVSDWVPKKDNANFESDTFL